jgi:hypothetical protein
MNKEQILQLLQDSSVQDPSSDSYEQRIIIDSDFEKIADILSSHPEKGNDDILVQALNQIIAGYKTDGLKEKLACSEMSAIAEQALSNYKSIQKGREMQVDHLEEGCNERDKQIKALEQEIERLKVVVKKQWEDKYPHPEAVQDLWEQFKNVNNL